MQEQTFNYYLIVIGLVAMGVNILLSRTANFTFLTFGIFLIIGGGMGMLTNSITVSMVTIGVLLATYLLFGRKFIQQRSANQNSPQKKPKGL